MGLFKKLKQGMGIGTITFDLEFPAQVPATSGIIVGTIIISAKSAQKINDVETHPLPAGLPCHGKPVWDRW